MIRINTKTHHTPANALPLPAARRVLERHAAHGRRRDSAPGSPWLHVRHQAAVDAVVHRLLVSVQCLPIEVLSDLHGPHQPA